MRAQTFHASYEKFYGLTLKQVATYSLLLAGNACARIAGT
jgi:hypothetical protein